MNLFLQSDVSEDSMQRKWYFCSKLLSLTNINKSFNKPKGQEKDISNKVGPHRKPRKN